MFDNPRFAGESNQPGERPVIPDVKPVVDASGAVGLENAGTALQMGLDLKDMYTIEKLRGEFEDSMEVVSSPNASLRDNFVSAVQAGNVEEIDKLSNQLGKLSLAEKQGVMGGSKHAMKLRQTELVRRAISDSPWLASEIRAVASTYSVAGFGKSGDGDSPNDPFIEAENKVIEAAYNLSLAGVPTELKAQLIRKAALTTQQWEAIDTRDKGKFVALAHEKVTVQGGIFESEFTKMVDEMKNTNSFNPDTLTATVAEAKGRMRNDIKQKHALAAANGATFGLSEAEIDNMVNAEFAFYDAAIKSEDPKVLLERRNAMRTAEGAEFWATSGTDFGMIYTSLGGTPAAAETAFKMAEKFGNIRRMFADNPDLAVSKLSPDEQVMWQMLASSDAQQKQMGEKMMYSFWNRGQIGGPAGAQAAVGLAPAYIDNPNASNPTLQAAKDAFNLLMDSKGDLGYQMFAEYVPGLVRNLDGKLVQGDGLPAHVVKPLSNKMERDEIAIQETLTTGSELFEMATVPGQVPEQKFFANYDAKQDRFVVTDADGEFVGRGFLPGTNKVLRSVNTLNHIYNTRKKWGMWDGKGSYQDKQGFVEWATGGGVMANDDGMPVPEDAAFEREVMSKMNNDIVRRTIIESEGGYQNDSSDKGNWTGGALGAGENVGTNMGITPVTLAAARGVDVSEITAEDMKNLKPEEAEEIYLTTYLKGPKIDKLPGENLQGIVFDMGVVMGPKRAIALMQEALGVTSDGVIGPETIFAARNTDLSKLRDSYKSYFKTVATRGENKKFLRGWMNRLDRTFATYTAGGTSV
jgi:lysozyme family protein